MTMRIISLLTFITFAGSSASTRKGSKNVPVILFPQGQPENAHVLKPLSPVALEVLNQECSLVFIKILTHKHVCMSVNGEPVIKIGSATCDSVPPTQDECDNIAIASGKFSNAMAGSNEDELSYCLNATAIGAYNSATARTFEATALTVGGRNNTAIANGYQSYAEAGKGNDNTALAMFEAADARAYSGDGNIAEVTFVGGKAKAINGNYNSATAGRDSVAEAFGGDYNVATAEFVGVAKAGYGNRNFASARNQLAKANAGGTSRKSRAYRNKAIATDNCIANARARTGECVCFERDFVLFQCVDCSDRVC